MSTSRFVIFTVMATLILSSMCCAMSINGLKGSIKVKGEPIKEQCCLPDLVTYQSTTYESNTIIMSTKYYDYNNERVRVDSLSGNKTRTTIVISDKSQSGMIYSYEFSNTTKCSCTYTYNQFTPTCYRLDGATSGTILGIEGRKIELSDSGAFDVQWIIKREKWATDVCVPLNAFYSDSSETFYTDYYNVVETVNPSVFQIPSGCPPLKQCSG